jgi:hypothetical protein
MRQVGGAVGVAVLGTVVNGAYRDHLPAGAGATVKDSVAAGVAVAGRLGDPALLTSVRSAFTSGMDVSLAVAGAVAVAGAILAVVFRPAAPPRPVASTVEIPAEVRAESAV